MLAMSHVYMANMAQHGGHVYMKHGPNMAVTWHMAEHGLNMAQHGRHVYMKHGGHMAGTWHMAEHGTWLSYMGAMFSLHMELTWLQHGTWLNMATWGVPHGGPNMAEETPRVVMGACPSATRVLPGCCFGAVGGGDGVEGGGQLVSNTQLMPPHVD